MKYHLFHPFHPFQNQNDFFLMPNILTVIPEKGFYNGPKLQVLWISKSGRE